MPTINNQADAQAIFKKAVRAAKDITKYVFHTDLFDQAGQWGIIIETDCPQAVGDAIEDIIKASKRGIYKGTTLHAGRFDWASDTYIKDAVQVFFKF